MGLLRCNSNPIFHAINTVYYSSDRNAPKNLGIYLHILSSRATIGKISESERENMKTVAMQQIQQQMQYQSILSCAFYSLALHRKACFTSDYRRRKAIFPSF